MALVIYDQGYRIQTPVRALFKPGGVDSLEPIKALHPGASEEQRTETEAERFRLQGAGQQEQKRPQPPAQRAYAASEKAAAPPSAPELLAAQIMTSPVHHISPETAIRDARARMRQLNIEHLVVVSIQQRPLALLSALDLDQSALPPQSPVATLHGRHLLAASPTTDASHLAASFIEFDLSAVPIVDAADTLVGIVTRTDLLRLLITGAHIERWA